MLCGGAGVGNLIVPLLPPRIIAGPRLRGCDDLQKLLSGRMVLCGGSGAGDLSGSQRKIGDIDIRKSRQRETERGGYKVNYTHTTNR